VCIFQPGVECCWGASHSNLLHLAPFSAERESDVKPKGEQSGEPLLFDLQIYFNLGYSLILLIAWIYTPKARLSLYSHFCSNEPPAAFCPVDVYL
jgi:hypothetical protein